MNDDFATTRQCELADVSRATIYAHQKPNLEDTDDLLLCRLIDEEYTRHPFCGTRRLDVIISAKVGLSGQPQTHPAPDAPDEIARHGAGSQHQPCAPAESGLSLFSPRP
jgi:hypothetical protein